MRKRVKMGRREMGIEDESGKCGKMPERERERKRQRMEGGLRRRRGGRQQGRRRVWLGGGRETESCRRKEGREGVSGRDGGEEEG